MNWGIHESLKYYPFAIEGKPNEFDPTFSNTLITISGIGIAISVIAGFLFFETFAYLGLRRCKYANRLRPKSAPNQTPKP